MPADDLYEDMQDSFVVKMRGSEALIFTSHRDIALHVLAIPSSNAMPVDGFAFRRMDAMRFAEAMQGAVYVGVDKGKHTADFTFPLGNNGVKVHVWVTDRRQIELSFSRDEHRGSASIPMNLRQTVHLIDWVRDHFAKSSLERIYTGVHSDKMIEAIEALEV